jgi:hypothetical protein
MARFSFMRHRIHVEHRFETSQSTTVRCDEPAGTLSHQIAEYSQYSYLSAAEEGMPSGLLPLKLPPFPGRFIHAKTSPPDGRKPPPRDPLSTRYFPTRPCRFRFLNLSPPFGGEQRPRLGPTTELRFRSHKNSGSHRGRGCILLPSIFEFQNGIPGQYES